MAEAAGDTPPAAVPVFYYRDGCHLCEAMFATLHRGWPRVAERVEWRDVDSSPAWRERFGLTLPALELNGEILCETVADPVILARCFGQPEVPV